MWVAGFLAGAAARADADLANAVAVIVNDAIITSYDVQTFIKPFVETAMRQYGSQSQMLQQKLVELERNGTETLVERQLILYDFKTGGYNLPESIIDDEIKREIRARYGDRLTLIKTLQEQGITYESYRQQTREQFIVGALSAKHLSSEIIISPHKIETHYVQNREKFKVEDQVKLRMIVLSKTAGGDGEASRKLAKEILIKLEEGASFAEMASVYSEGSPRYQGGDRGWIERSSSDLRKELAEVAFSLPKGQRSGIIETPEAIFLMLVEDKRPAHVKSLAEVREQIESDLLAQERARVRKRWIERLTKKSFVRYF